VGYDASSGKQRGQITKLQSCSFENASAEIFLHFSTYLKLPESSAARRNDLRYQLAEFWQKRKIQESKN
jgi:hypothetical protein